MLTKGYSSCVGRRKSPTSAPRAAARLATLPPSRAAPARCGRDPTAPPRGSCSSKGKCAKRDTFVAGGGKKPRPAPPTRRQEKKAQNRGKRTRLTPSHGC